MGTVDTSVISLSTKDNELLAKYYYNNTIENYTAMKGDHLLDNFIDDAIVNMFV